MQFTTIAQLSLQVYMFTACCKELQLPITGSFRMVMKRSPDQKMIRGFILPFILFYSTTWPVEIQHVSQICSFQIDFQ
jgi:hypothetical protein